MSRIAVIASLALVAPHITGTCPARHVLPGDQELIAETFPATPVPKTTIQPILWHPAADHDSQFGLIPTEIQTTTELLPLTWQARVVFAGENGTVAQPSSPHAPPATGPAVRQFRR